MKRRRRMMTLLRKRVGKKINKIKKSGSAIVNVCLKHKNNLSLVIGSWDRMFVWREWMFEG